MIRRLLIATLLTGAAFLLMPAAQAATPRFQIRCVAGHLAQEDPIVAPGTMSGHMHQFFGNATTTKDSTYASMVGQPTTCSTTNDSAGYWVPTLLDGSNTIAPKSMLIYYRFPNGSQTQAFPPDLRMVSYNSVPQPMDSNNLVVKFPSCWDGVHTDSPDHISHMAYLMGGKCPASHPVNVPAITEIVRFVSGFKVTGKKLSSDIQLGAPSLSTMHADFWNTWNQAALEDLVARCDSTNCGKIDG
jgi:Domain of unknown function (DUF1996)